MADQTAVEANRLARAQRREQFIDLAATLVRDEGISAVTMERVAAAAGLSKPVVYRHFHDRGELLVALLERCWAEVDRSVSLRLRDTTTFDARLDALVVGYFDAIAAQGPLVALMIGTASPEPVLEAARRQRHRTAEAEWSEFYQRRAGLDPATADTAAAIMRSALQGAAAYWLAHPGTAPEPVIDTCLRVMRAGLTALRHPPVAPPPVGGPHPGVGPPRG